MFFKCNIVNFHGFSCFKFFDFFSFKINGCFSSASFFDSPVLILCHVFISWKPQCQGRGTLWYVITVIPKSFANVENQFDIFTMMSLWSVHHIYDVVFHMMKPSFRLIFWKPCQYSVWERGKAHVRVHYFPVFELEFKTQSHSSEHLLGKHTQSLFNIVMVNN